jgi:hypothetical protein
MNRLYIKLTILISTLILASALQVHSFPQDDGKDNDGHYRHPFTGEVEPDMCDNSFKNEHPCTCNHADDMCTYPNSTPSYKCKTYCRPKACKCVNSCTS